MIVPLLRRIGSGKFSCSQLCNECESCQQLVLPNISDCSVVTKEDCEDNRSKFGCLKLCNVTKHQRLLSCYERRDVLA